MANWKYKLDVSDIFHSDKPVQEIGKVIASRIKAKFPKGWLNPENESSYDEELDMIVDQLENVGDVQEFDYVWDAFYDWCDQEIEPFDHWPTNKMCWVTTF